MTALFNALLDDATEEDLHRLARQLGPYLDAKTAGPEVTRWLNLKEACDYLSTRPSRLYSLVSARRIPFHKDGSRLLFDRNELDGWVRAGGATRP